MADILNNNLTPEGIIGRRDELAAIETAIVNAEHAPVCYYLVGGGGIGKTYLLHNIHQRVKELRKERDLKLLETGVIDLYHVRYHQPIMLMNALADRLHFSLKQIDDTREFFDTYKDAAQQYLRARGSGPATETQLYERIRATFLECYKALAEKYRIVLTVDTFEKLDPEIKQIEPFKFRPTSRLQDWLVNLIDKLPNTLTVLAGRPRPKQEALLTNRLGEKRKRFEIKPFSREETQAYTEAVLGPAPPDSERNSNIYRLSKGKPVVLILVLSCVRAGAFDIESLPPGLEPEASEDEIEEQIAEHFIDKVIAELNMNSPDLADLLRKAAYLRKGLNEDLLLYLEHKGETSLNEEEEAEPLELLSKFKQMPIVKITGDDIAILHDEIYDILFNYHHTDEQLASEWYDLAVSYLGDQLTTIRSDIQQHRLTTERLQRLQTTQVEYLFYRMARSPLVGYQDYREQVMSAISSHDEDFDTQLQDELARFYEQEGKWGDYYRRRLEETGYSWDLICYDESVNWVYRCLNTHFYGSQERYPKARELAKLVRQTYPHIYRNNSLARAALDTAELEARVYSKDASRQSADILQKYQEVSTLLEQIRETTVDMSDLEQVNRAFASFTLALANYTRGYYERTQQLYESAITHYRESLRLFRELGRETDTLWATTLNNLGFVLMLQGQPDLGYQMSAKALEVSKQNGALYSAALAHNTLARILLELDQASDALQNVEQAREIFEEFESERGLALCAFAEGEIYRWLAYQRRQDRDRSNAEYSQAIERYEKAQHTLDEEKVETIRRVEVRQGLGCAYRSRGYASSQRGENCTQDMEQAIKFFREAIDLYVSEASPEQEPEAKQLSPLVTSVHEDIAVAYVNHGRYDEALRTLDEAQATIPPEYAIREREGIVETEAMRERKSFWLQLGQIELQRGLCYYEQKDYHQFCTAILRAFGCILTFSPQARQMYTIRSLTRSRLLHLSSKELDVLQYQMYKTANELNLDEAFKEMDYLFDEAINYAGIF